MYVCISPVVHSGGCVSQRGVSWTRVCLVLGSRPSVPLQCIGGTGVTEGMDLLNDCV